MTINELLIVVVIAHCTVVQGDKAQSRVPSEMNHLAVPLGSVYRQGEDAGTHGESMQIQASSSNRIQLSCGGGGGEMSRAGSGAVGPGAVDGLCSWWLCVGHMYNVSCGPTAAQTILRLQCRPK